MSLGGLGRNECTWRLQWLERWNWQWKLNSKLFFSQFCLQFSQPQTFWIAGNFRYLNPTTSCYKQRKRKPGNFRNYQNSQIGNGRITVVLWADWLTALNTFHWIMFWSGICSELWNMQSPTNPEYKRVQRSPAGRQVVYFNKLFLVVIHWFPQKYTHMIFFLLTWLKSQDREK